MTWLQPWAFLGSLALALPIIIHLLGRGRANRHRFPSLRFVESSRLLPTRRTRVHDPLLLLIRLLVLATAIVALAAPRWTTSARTQRLASTTARVVIIDTSASMTRAATDGQSALTVAEATLEQLGDPGSATMIIRSANPAAAIPSGVRWLQHQAGRVELVVLSDFQAGTVDSVALSRVPATIGITLIPTRRPPLPPELRRSVTRTSGVVATVREEGGARRFSWQPDTSGHYPRVNSYSAPGTERVLAATRAAAEELPLPLPVDTTHQIMVLFGEAPNRAELLSHAGMPVSPWMADLLNRLDRDPLLPDLLRRTPAGDESNSPVPLSFRGDRRADSALSAASIVVGSDSHLVILSDAAAGTYEAAALLAAVSRARGHAAWPGEIDPAVIDSATLSRWSRAASTSEMRHPAAASEIDSDARWFWFASLALLGVEALIRRRPRAETGSYGTA